MNQNKNETEYIKKYSFKDRLENTEVSNAIKEFDYNLKDNIKRKHILIYEFNTDSKHDFKYFSALYARTITLTNS